MNKLIINSNELIATQTVCKPNALVFFYIVKTSYLIHLLNSEIMTEKCRTEPGPLVAGVRA